MMDWVVTGSRPPSAMSSRPSSVMSSRPGSSLHHDNIFKAKSQSQGYSYADRLFGSPAGQNSSRENMYGTVTPSPSARSIKNTSKHNPSYVDETLFGPSPRDEKFEALWGGNSVRSLKGGYNTDRTSETGHTQRLVKNDSPQKKHLNQTYKKNLSSRSDINNSNSVPNSSRANTPSKTSTVYGGKKSFRGIHTPSYVDEMLFGEKLAEPDFPAPWESSGPTPKPYAFDATDYKAKLNDSQTQETPGRESVRSPKSSTHTRPGSASRPPSTTPTRPGSAIKKAPRQRHTPSYVDEMLFGPKPSEPNFPAPWEDPKAEKKKPKPFIFDATDYSKLSNRPESARNKTRPGSSTSPKKPAWR